MRRRLLLAVLVLPGLAAGCGGDDPPPDPADAVRETAAAFVGALRAERWADACRLMTVAARTAIAGERGRCPQAFREGAALPPSELGTIARQLPGAPVRITGVKAALGPVGDTPQPLRLERSDGRWLIAP